MGQTPCGAQATSIFQRVTSAQPAGSGALAKLTSSFIECAPMSRSKSLIQAVELWFPQGEVMAFGAGAYRGYDDLRHERERLCFHQGEGLPGTVWEKGKALLFQTAGGEFLSAERAAEVGIDVAVGCPLFDGGRLFAVLTLLLTNRSEAP